jgi:hypothetical protein
MRGQSCNYQQMYDMPCRMACNRYASAGDKFEGAFPKESYEYEPKIEREMYVPLNPLNPMKNKKQVIKNKNQQQNQQSCNCSPKIYVKESYDYDPVVFNPRQNVESYSQKSGCDCGHLNPPYRMQECNYNQSPSWVTQKSGVPLNPELVQPLPTQEQPQPVQESYAPFMNNTDMNMATGMNIVGNNNNYSNGCGCGSKNSSYRMDESCDYNQSPTWVDQRSFRDNVLNRY